MSKFLDCRNDDLQDLILDEAARTIERGELIVMPTDTVYGIAANAFSSAAVADLLAAKGRSRQMPPPVLIPRPETLDGLADNVSAEVRNLAKEFWPGALTIICDAQPSLDWDLGETHGTVAIRMPDDETALAVLGRTGPLAVSSANLTGQPAAVSAAAAREQLGDAVALYLEAGETPGELPSTIVDSTVTPMRIVRRGALGVERLREIVPELLDLGEEDSSPEAPQGTDGVSSDENLPATEDTSGPVDASAPSETPADETPTEETPAEETPTDVVVAEETPADETPTEETPS